jgi:ribonuclease J
MNLYVYESDSDALVVDCGVQFADPDRLGIDSILPDLSYLGEIQDKLRAVLFTHGHEDHVGAASYLLERFPLPVYASRFTIELLKRKLEQQGISAQLHTVRDKEEISFGSLKAVFFAVPHSIPDSMGLLIGDGDFSAMHISDFRANKGDLSFLPSVAVSCLLLDSTNAMSHAREESSEYEVAAELERLFAQCKGRVFVTTFSSNIERVGAVIKAARATGRKVLLEGAAMERTVNTAFSIGLLASAGDVTLPEAHKMRPEELVFVVSGCQGEHSSALYNIAMKERKSLYIKQGDMLIFSSRVIPGNEDNVNRIINAVLKSGGEVVKPDDANVHISGHALPPALEAVIERIKPSWFIPVHGEYQHMVAHRALAVKAGIDEDRILMMETGNQLVFQGGELVQGLEVKAERQYYDNRGGFYLQGSDLSERGRLARDGAVAVQMRNGEVDMISMGFPMDEEKLALAREYIATEVGLENETEQDRIKRVLRKFFKKQMKRRPMIAVFMDK